MLGSRRCRCDAHFNKSPPSPPPTTRATQKASRLCGLLFCSVFGRTVRIVLANLVTTAMIEPAGDLNLPHLFFCFVIQVSKRGFLFLQSSLKLFYDPGTVVRECRRARVPSPGTCCSVRNRRASVPEIWTECVIKVRECVGVFPLLLLLWNVGWWARGRGDSRPTINKITIKWSGLESRFDRRFWTLGIPNQNTVQTDIQRVMPVDTSSSKRLQRENIIVHSCWQIK